MIELFTDNKPVLKPYETGIVLDAFLIDTEYLLEPDADDVYRLTFATYSADDDSRLEEHLSNCMAQVEMTSGYNSNKTVCFNGESREGFYRCSTMFKPKVSLRVNHWSELMNRHCSLNLFVNDSPTGELYLNVAYVDPYEIPEGIDEDEMLDPSQIDHLF